MKVINAVFAISLLTLAGAQSGFAQTSMLQRDMVDHDGQLMGSAEVLSNSKGPDSVQIRMWDLEPEAEFSVVLAAHGSSGSVPAVFLGQFAADRRGNASFQAMTEVVDAYLVVNQGLEDETGQADSAELGFPPAAVGEGGVAVPLTYFRIYSVRPNRVRSRFGVNAYSIGGGHIASSKGALSEFSSPVLNAKF